MANGNGHNGKGNGKNGAYGNIGKEISSFSLAEAASEAVWIGLVAVEDKLIPRSLMKQVSSVVGKVVVEPYLLDLIERHYDKFCKLEECRPDMTKTRQERAEEFATLMVKYIPAIALAWETKVKARRFLNKKVGLPEDDLKAALPAGTPTWKKAMSLVPGVGWSPQERMIFLADEGMHLGSLYVLNNQLAPETDDMIRSTTGMIQSIFGTSRRKAHELATGAWVWVVPNSIGALGGLLAISGKHLSDWPKGAIGRFLGRKNGQHPTSPSL